MKPQTGCKRQQKDKLNGILRSTSKKQNLRRERSKKRICRSQKQMLIPINTRKQNEKVGSDKPAVHD